MVNKDNVNNAYFNWLYDLVCGGRFARDISFRRLLIKLHSTEFTYTVRRDRALASWGENLRYRFPYEQLGIDDIERYICRPCTMLELMVILAIKCEEDIMDNPAYGDRTGQWFWNMMSSLGLSSMSDDIYDRDYVEYAISRFLNREYEPNGKGGLFTIRDCEVDLRNVEIWTQMCWYLDTIT